MRGLSGSSFVACSYFEIASSMFDALAWSPSFARLTASMLLRLHARRRASRRPTTSRDLVAHGGRGVYENAQRGVYCVRDAQNEDAVGIATPAALVSTAELGRRRSSASSDVSRPG